jgi:4-amino-4-deoxy-L-arabinose transferase-like glycosyltransferase
MNDTGERGASRASATVGLHRRLGGWAVVALVAVAVHLAVFDRGLGGDGWATFAFLQSVLDDGDTFLENNHRGVMNGLLARPDGHLVMQYPPGVPMLDAAPVLLARAADAALPTAWLAGGVVVPPVGQVPRRTFLEVAAIVAARNFAVLLGLVVIVAALRRLGHDDRSAAVAAALTFFGGPLVFYGLIGASHAPSFALASLLLWVLVRSEAEPSDRMALASGLLVGVAMLVRYSAVALLPAALLVRPATGRRRAVALALTGCLLPLVVLPPFWRLHHGQWWPLPYGGSLAPTLAAPWNVLFAPQHGVAFFHPALLIAAIGLVCAWRRRGESGRRLHAAALLWLVAVATLHGWWSDWANPGGWGQRFVTDALPAFALGFAVRPETKLVRRAALGAAVVGAALSWWMFFAAAGGLARPPAGHPWPQRPGDYASLLSDPPSPAELRDALLRASFLLRAVTSSEPAALPP